MLLHFLRLPAEERLLILEALWLLLRVRVALWRSPFRVVQTRFAPARHLRAAPVAPPRGGYETVSLSIRRASRVVPAANCLTQALAARILLARRDMPSELRIGVAKDDRGVLQAHAWVEAKGLIVIGELEDLPRFARLPVLPHHGP